MLEDQCRAQTLSLHVIRTARHFLNAKALLRIRGERSAELDKQIRAVDADGEWLTAGPVDGARLFGTAPFRQSVTPLCNPSLGRNNVSDDSDVGAIAKFVAHGQVVRRRCPSRGGHHHHSQKHLSVHDFFSRFHSCAVATMTATSRRRSSTSTHSSGP